MTQGLLRTAYCTDICSMANSPDIIVAPATPPGGALAVIRLSGAGSIALVQRIFRGRDLRQRPGHSLTFGRITDGDVVLDEVLAAVFHAPHSYTREEVVELSCHGSPYILRRLLAMLCELGARMAEPGEFTRRAFLNGAMDLAQAEAVADLIAADSLAAQQLAMQQLRGGISHELATLREQLLGFAALLELELDFSEEDVEFADRSQLVGTVDRTLDRLAALAGSFAAGNALKQGIPTVIIGKPNAGKSTLLNALLRDNRAIVSDIPGTTRDVIEDSLHLGGYLFRLTDTAGLRNEAADAVEAEGIRRTLERLGSAAVVFFLYDAGAEGYKQAKAYFDTLQVPHGARVLYVANKCDLTSVKEPDVIAISAKNQTGLEELTRALIAHADSLHSADTLITQQRHQSALLAARTALVALRQGLQAGLSGEMVALDLRLALQHLGEITGEITTDEVLGAIFSKFCIGK